MPKILVTGGAGEGISAENIAAVARLLQALKNIIIRTAEGFIPLPDAIGIQFHNPIIRRSKTVVGLGVRLAGIRISTDNIAAVARLLQAVKIIIAGSAEGFVPLNVGRGGLGQGEVRAQKHGARGQQADDGFCDLNIHLLLSSSDPASAADHRVDRIELAQQPCQDAGNVEQN